MVIMFFLLIILFFQFIKTNFMNNPILLNYQKYPFVLPYYDNNYYYIITTGQNLKINKENGSVENIGENNFSNKPLYCFDKSNNSYIYEEKIFYNVSYPFDNIIQISQNKNKNSLNEKYIGCIPQDNDFIMYGSNSHYLTFFSLSQDNNYKLYINDLGDDISCKFIENEKFICSTIIDKTINFMPAC